MGRHGLIMRLGSLGSTYLALLEMDLADDDHRNRKQEGSDYSDDRNLQDSGVSKHCDTVVFHIWATLYKSY